MRERHLAMDLRDNIIMFNTKVVIRPLKYTLCWHAEGFLSFEDIRIGFLSTPVSIASAAYVLLINYHRKLMWKSGMGIGKKYISCATILLC